MDTDLGGGGGASGMDEAEAAFFARRGRRCCCFPWPSSASSHQRVGGAEEESWWQRAVDAVLKVREWSELVAGPRWKTFIRRFGRGGGGGGGPRPHNYGRKLNYDALSYALNFDEGHGASPEGDYTGYRDFSARFAAPPASAKSSMDLGGRDAPPLFNPPPPHDGAGRA
ncbi:uncharacterized protein LOC127763623 [Oryza glaberrima]|jgi:hypothetical protein|uniref:NHL repeat-containing protein-like n=3 Tax=Oryza TaxID=4527 RepID=A0A0D9YY44_9ORYZ|nr:uncharacterized protein LOC127763623 [Oryza glaberrima]